MFRVRGVRLWLGYADAGEDPDVGPLRQVKSLCGLALGPDDFADHRTHCGGRSDNDSERGTGIRLATFLGQAIDIGDQAQEHVAGRQGLKAKETGGGA